MNTATTTPRCPVCGEGHVHDTTIAKDRTIRHNCESHTVHIPDLIVGKCDRCGEIFLDNRADRQTQDSLREVLGFLTPDEIVAYRHHWDKTQREVSESTGIAVETLSRWESGHVIQSRSHDILLRMYFERLAQQQEASQFSWASVLGACDSTGMAANSNYSLAA